MDIPWGRSCEYLPTSGRCGAPRLPARSEELWPAARCPLLAAAGCLPELLMRLSSAVTATAALPRPAGNTIHPTAAR
jgi:hypothetical protein